MKHSKHLTVLIAMLLVLLLFGVVFYLYLSALGLSPVAEQSVVDESDSGDVTATSDEEDVRVKLEAVMDMQDPTPTAASTTETITRLQAVMENTEPSDADAVQARLEAVMNIN